MNPFSLPVLGGAALVSSPALWNSVAGETALRVGLSRYLVAVVVCWLALSLLAMVVGPVPPPADEAGNPTEHPSDAVATRADEEQAAHR